MRSGKTSTLKNKILALVFEGKLAYVLRPQGDSQRWSQDEKHPNRVTHDGLSYLPIDLPKDAYSRLQVVETRKLMDQVDTIRKMKIDEVFIDEFQFFNALDDARMFLQAMAKDERRVVIAGLTLDWKRTMFAVVLECYGLFTKVLQRYALCTKCGKEASFTAKLDTTSNAVLQMGDKEYESRCHACFI